MKKHSPPSSQVSPQTSLQADPQIKEIRSQLKNRNLSSLNFPSLPPSAQIPPPEENLSLEENYRNKVFILEAPNDTGVMRNGGKRGSRHAPLAIITKVKKMLYPQEFTPKWERFEVSSPRANDFSQEQERERKEIEKLLWGGYPEKGLIHLGGGHDHAFALGAALLKNFHSIALINIDAHLDTRVDRLPHSGTPFRQLNNYSKKVNLFQVGIHESFNPPSNFQNMKKMKILTMEEINREKRKGEKDPFQELESFLKKQNGALFLSLDADGLDSSFMPAVSASNPQGLQKNQMENIIHLCKNYWRKHKLPPFLGIYEYNPLFDNLHASGAQYLASLIYKVLT